MDESNPDTVPEWKTDLNPAGKVLLTLVHAGSPREYLSGKAQRTYLSLSPEQARDLAEDLRDAAARSHQSPETTPVGR